MNIADLLIIFLFIFTVYKGLRIGFTREIFATAGFVLSILLGALLIPIVIKHVSGANSKAVWAVSIMLISMAIFVTIGEMIGYKLKLKVIKKTPLEKTDKVLGGILRFGGTLLVVWIVGSILIRFPYTAVNSSCNKHAGMLNISGESPRAPADIIRATFAPYKALN